MTHAHVLAVSSGLWALDSGGAPLVEPLASSPMLWTLSLSNAITHDCRRLVVACPVVHA